VCVCVRVWSFACVCACVGVLACEWNPVIHQVFVRECAQGAVFTLSLPPDATGVRAHTQHTHTTHTHKPRSCAGPDNRATRSSSLVSASAISPRIKLRGEERVRQRKGGRESKRERSESESVSKSERHRNKDRQRGREGGTKGRREGGREAGRAHPRPEKGRGKLTN